MMMMVIVIIIIIIIIIKKCYSSYKRYDWNHFKITQTILERRTGKAGN